MARLVEGMGSIDSPTHTQKVCVESDLSAMKLFAQFTVLLLGYGGFGRSIHEVAWLELCCLRLVEGAIHMVTFWEGAYKASRSFEANCMFLVVEGACAVLEDCALHSGCDTVHVPKGIANILICMSMHMGFQRTPKVWEVYEIGNGGGRCRCNQSCLFSSQPSSIVEGVAAWASTRNAGIGQIVIFEASLVFSNSTCALIPSYFSVGFDLIEKDVILRGAGK
eukprot:1032281-Pelagomonas_calceolata.AAC.1